MHVVARHISKGREEHDGQGDVNWGIYLEPMDGVLNRKELLHRVRASLASPT